MFGALAGVILGEFVAIQLGLMLHDNYEYYNPDTPAGMALALSGAAIGLSLPLALQWAGKSIRHRDRV
jgi:hypothetical protein